MKNFSPERLEYLLSNMPTDMSLFEQRIKEIGLFDYDGIYATDISAGILRYAREAEERNEYAADKLRTAFENVWEAEEAGVIKLREIREQLGEYNAYIQRLGDALTVDKGFSANGMHKNIQGIMQMYPTVGMDSLALIKIQREISRFVKEFFAKPDMLQGMSQKDIEAFLTSFESLHPGALTIAGVFLKKLQSDKYDYSKVRNYIKTFLYCGMERNGTYEPANYRYKDELTPETIEELKEEIGLPDDFKVDKVVVLNQPDGAGGAGHTAVMLIGEDGSGLYYSYHGNFEGNELSIYMGNSVDGEMKRVYLNSDEVKEFCTGDQSGMISLYTDEVKAEDDKPYVNGIVIDINEEQGWEMISEAERIRNDETEQYNLYANNCGHRVSQILLAGEVKYASSEGSTLDERLEAATNNSIQLQNGQNVQIPIGIYWIDNARNYAFGSVSLYYNIAENITNIKTDGTIPNSTFEMESQNADETGRVSGTLDTLYNDGAI